MKNLTDRNVGRITQKLVSRASTITLADVRAYRARNPLCAATDDEVRALVLAEHPCDLGFLAR